jgi:hypothetical protein
MGVLWVAFDPCPVYVRDLLAVGGDQTLTLSILRAPRGGGDYERSYPKKPRRPILDSDAAISSATSLGRRH